MSKVDLLKNWLQQYELDDGDELALSDLVTVIVRDHIHKVLTQIRDRFHWVISTQISDRRQSLRFYESGREDGSLEDIADEGAVGGGFVIELTPEKFAAMCAEDFDDLNDDPEHDARRAAFMDQFEKVAREAADRWRMRSIGQPGDPP